MNYSLNMILGLAVLAGANAQNCGNTAMCVQQYKGTVQSGCGGVSNSESCLCQNYQSILSNCFSGCNDPNSLMQMQEVQTQMMGYCRNGNPSATMGGFGMNNGMFGMASSALIINDGPTGIAIPMNSNMNPYNQNPATISLANTPIRINNGLASMPSLAIPLVTAMLARFFLQ